MSRQYDEHVEAEAEKAQHAAVAQALGSGPIDVRRWI